MRSSHCIEEPSNVSICKIFFCQDCFFRKDFQIPAWRIRRLTARIVGVKKGKEFLKNLPTSLPYPLLCQVLEPLGLNCSRDESPWLLLGCRVVVAGWAELHRETRDLTFPQTFDQFFYISLYLLRYLCIQFLSLLGILLGKLEFFLVAFLFVDTSFSLLLQCLTLTEKAKAFLEPYFQFFPQEKEKGRGQAKHFPFKVQRYILRYVLIY